MILEALIVALAALLVYLNSIHGEFVFDDGPVLTATRKMYGFPASFWLRCMRPWRRSLMPRPLLFITYRVDYALWRDNPAGWHLTNIGIHALNTVLVLLILSRFFAGHGSLLGALVFAVHPLATSAVASISGRSSSLCALFYLTGLLAVLNHSWVVAAGLCWLAWKCKGEAAVFPFAVLVTYVGQKLL